MKLQLTYHFDGEDELRAHLAAGDTRVADQATALARLAGTTALTTTTVADEPGVAADRSAVDGDGMPYDAAVHSDPPSMTTKGLWKSQRGKATEADAARAAWKARGGTVVAPVVPAAPVAAPVAGAMPGMPVALPVAAPPVSMDQVIAAASAAQARGVSVERIGAIYGVIGLTDMAQFDTNETMRAAFVTEVNKLV